MPGTRPILIPCVLGALGVLCPPALAAEAPSDPLFQRLVFEHTNDRPVSNVSGTERMVSTQTVDYATVDGQPVSGYMARPPADDGPTPGVLVIHEWWGLNDNIRSMTRRLAANGYTALAVDLYGGETASTPERARALMEDAMAETDRLERNLSQGFLYLDVMPSTDRLGSLGWCFGGGWSLRTALLFPEALDAAVIYYGELVTDPQTLRPLTMPILGHFGAEDSSIPPARVRRFGEVLEELGKPHQLHVYDDVGHAFANPSGTRYARDAAEQAWSRTIDFLDRTLQAE